MQAFLATLLPYCQHQGRHKVSRLMRVLASVIILGWPHVGQAAGLGQDDSAAEVTRVVGLFLLVGMLYLFVHFLLDRLQRKLLIVSGLEYVLLGLLLGPSAFGTGLFNDASLDAMMPLVALAVGWVGLLRGVDMSPTSLGHAPTGAAQLAFASAAISSIAFLIFGYLLFEYPSFFALGTLSSNHGQAWLAASLLACTSIVGSSEPIDVLKLRYHIEGKNLPLLRRTALFTDVIALFAVGIAFAIFHQNTNIAGQPSETEWVVISLGIGISLGLLFRFFLQEKEHESTKLLALIGIITFASGAAYFMELSPLMINLVLGIVLVSFTPSATQYRPTLERTQKPMSLLLLVFAGILWTPPEQWQHTLIGLTVYIVLRPLTKLIASAVSSLNVPTTRWDLAKGLLGHGDVTVAMAVSFKLIYSGDVIDTVYSIVLGSFVVYDIIAPRILRSLLIDSGNIRNKHSAAF